MTVTFRGALKIIELPRFGLMADPRRVGGVLVCPGAGTAFVKTHDDWHVYPLPHAAAQEKL